jgi:hypothetical protein
MCPLLIKGLKEETAIKRKASNIISNMSKLVTNPSDADAFLPKLLPRLEVRDVLCDYVMLCRWHGFGASDGRAWCGQPRWDGQRLRAWFLQAGCLLLACWSLLTLVLCVYCVS